jgi:hypothetical protein
MRTFTGKFGTKYLTFKTPRGSYHTFSEFIARDAAADCGSDQGITNQRWAKQFKVGLIQLEALVAGVVAGFPRGTKATAQAEGLFKEVKLNRGRPMAPASQDA